MRVPGWCHKCRMLCTMVTLRVPLSIKRAGGRDMVIGVCDDCKEARWR